MLMNHRINTHLICHYHNLESDFDYKTKSGFCGFIKVNIKAFSDDFDE